MASFLRFGNTAKAAVLTAGLTTAAVSTVSFAKDKSFFEDEAAPVGSYDPNFASANNIVTLPMPDRMGTPKQKFASLQHSISGTSGVNVRYTHKAPTNEVDVSYNVLAADAPKYGKGEMTLRVEGIECTRDTVGTSSAQFEAPYVPIMVYFKDDPEDSFLVAQMPLTLSPSSLTMVKVISSAANGKQLSCNFNQSLTPSLSAGVDLTVLLGNNQSVYSASLNHHGCTSDGFIQDLGLEVSSRGDATVSFVRPVSNGLVLGAEYHLELMQQKSTVSAVARFRTDKTRTTVRYSSAGSVAGQLEYIYNKNIKLVGNTTYQSDKGTTMGVSIEFDRLIEGTFYIFCFCVF